MDMDEFFKQKQEDLFWIQKFLVSRNLSFKSGEKTKNEGTGIHEAKITINKIFNKLHELKSVRNKMDENCGVLDELDWKEHLESANKLKNELQKCSNLFDFLPKYEQLKTKIIQRRKKRIRIKNKKFKIQRNEEEVLKNRLKLDKKITEWQLLKLVENVGEKSKSEENLEVNLKLSEVTHKKNEAKKHIEILTGLKDLRRARKNVIGKGQVGEKHFENKIDNLLGYWNNTLEVHTKEEMEIKEKQLNKNTIENKWNRVLFGEPIKQYDNPLLSGEKDFNSLCDTRIGWDNFLTDIDDPFGSSIPLGWVLPNTNPLLEWSKYRI